MHKKAGNYLFDHVTSIPIFYSNETWSTIKAAPIPVFYFSLLQFGSYLGLTAY